MCQFYFYKLYGARSILNTIKQSLSLVKHSVTVYTIVLQTIPKLSLQYDTMCSGQSSVVLEFLRNELPCYGICMLNLSLQ